MELTGWVGGTGHQGLTGLDLDGGMHVFSFMVGHIPGLHMKGSPACLGRSILACAEQVEPLISACVL